MFRTLVLLLLSVSLVGAEALENSPTIKFKKVQLDADFRSEGVTVGDYNQDGKLDIAAGFVWYEAPDWTRHKITADAKTYQPKGYSNSFVNYTQDMNADGWDDVIVVDFPGTPTWWFENPQSQAGPWKRHTVTPVSNNESPQFADVTGDGRREFIMGVNSDRQNPDGPQRQMAILRQPTNPTDAWTIQAISARSAPGSRKYSHGLGVGDVNGDGRNDVLVKEGWWEAPEGFAEQRWEFHPADFGEDCSHMYAYDFDGDGDNDVLSASAHRFGIWWTERKPDGSWQRHTIDDTFSQTHSLMLVDINGDGLKDFVTGKRWWAHGGNDPGGDQPAMLYWFELVRANGTAKWKRHEIDHNSGIGTQFEVADVNGDGLLDIVASSKKGVHYFEQTRAQ